jgi:hypothetical protein
MVVTADPLTKAGAATALEIYNLRWHALHRW